MKILIIGGTRFIGRHVITLLQQEGHELTLFNRGRTENPFQETIKVIKGDRKLSGDLLAKTKDTKFDAVIDMIAYTEEDAVEGIKAFNDKTNHYIMISTRSVYKQPINIPIRETDALEDNPEVSYGYNKVAAENKFIKAYHKTGFPISILRLPAVYGEYDYQTREWYFIKRILDKRENILLPDFGKGINQREYTGNIANQINFILNNRKNTLGETYNSGHREYHRYEDLVSIAADLMNHKMNYYGIKNDYMPWSVPLANDGIRICSTGKLEALGYVEKYSVKDGLSNIIKYFRENPVKEFLFAKRQDIDMFNYELEDRLIKEQAIKL